MQQCLDAGDRHTIGYFPGNRNYIITNRQPVLETRGGSGRGDPIGVTTSAVVVDTRRGLRARRGGKPARGYEAVYHVLPYT